MGRKPPPMCDILLTTGGRVLHDLREEKHIAKELHAEWHERSLDFFGNDTKTARSSAGSGLVIHALPEPISAPNDRFLVNVSANTCTAEMDWI